MRLVIGSVRMIRLSLCNRSETNPVIAAELYRQTVDKSHFEVIFCLSLPFYDNQFSTFCSASPSDTVTATMQDMQKSSSNSMWYTDVHYNPIGRICYAMKNMINFADPNEINGSLCSLYQEAPSNTLLLVVTQGNFTALRLLIAKKQRYLSRNIICMTVVSSKMANECESTKATIC